MINCLLPDVADGIAYDFVCCMVMDYVETMLWTRFLCVDIAVDLLNFASSNFQFMFLTSMPFLRFSSNSTQMFDKHGVDDVQGLRLSCKNMMPIHILGHYDVDIIWFPSNIST